MSLERVTLSSHITTVVLAAVGHSAGPQGEARCPGGARRGGPVGGAPPKRISALRAPRPLTFGVQPLRVEPGMRVEDAAEGGPGVRHGGDLRNASVRWIKAADGARAAPDSRVDTGGAAPRRALPPRAAAPARACRTHAHLPPVPSTPSLLQRHHRLTTIRTPAPSPASVSLTELAHRAKFASEDRDLPKMDWSKYDTFPGSFEKCTLLTAALTHVGLYILMFLGFVNQLLFKPKVATEKNREGYATLYDPFETFFSRYVYRRVRHCFNRPICSAPGAEVTLKERATDDRNWTFRFTGVEQRCINLGSYNYLGFAEGEGGCTQAAVQRAVRRYGLALCSPRAELGSTPLHAELEETTARFLGVEAALVVGMGFGTNTLGLPGLLGPGCLALSDENNHASLILGLRLARATVRVFRHNDVRHLEQLARQARKEGKWRKIVIVVEGVYSMEGSIVPLGALVALKKRLGLQLYLDEAHSVGALGPRGRGVTDHAGVAPTDVDVLMGTFTKSFGAAGGYIAGSKKLIDWVRAHGHAHTYAHSMSPPVAQQILSAMRLLDTPAGQARVRQLKENTHYFREQLRSMGVVTFGHRDSPVVPLLVYTFSKMAATVERLTARGIATVGVGFPATPLNKARIRFCLSASHSRAQLDACLLAVRQVVRELGLSYSRQQLPDHDPAHSPTA